MPATSPVIMSPRAGGTASMSASGLAVAYAEAKGPEEANIAVFHNRPYQLV